MEKSYVVWVGGVEVNNYFLTLSEAKELEKEYRSLGYVDVIIQRLK